MKKRENLDENPVKTTMNESIEPPMDADMRR